MIISYPNGEAFINDNASYLNQNKYLSAFFFLDAPLLTESSPKNYAIKVYSNDKQLLGILVEPYNLLLYGDVELLEEMLTFIKDNGLELPGIFGPTNIGERFLEISQELLGKEYHTLVSMDFMEATEITEPSSNEVEIPNLDDVDELCECMVNFIKDCGLTDPVVKDKIASNISNYRIIRRDNKIVSLSRRSPETDNSVRISAVYTRPEYRGQKLARKVVNNIKNEIINEGMIATLNVDQLNPISNHLYSSLGFKKVFSQGVYVLRK